MSTTDTIKNMKYIISYNSFYSDTTNGIEYSEKCYIPDPRVFSFSDSNCFYEAMVFDTWEEANIYRYKYRDSDERIYMVIVKISSQEARECEKFKALQIAKHLFPDMKKGTPYYIYADMLEDRGLQREAKALRNRASIKDKRILKGHTNVAE